MRKKLYRGPIGKALAKGGNIADALNTVADRWIAGVSQAKGSYEAGLAKYLGFYEPRIEQFYANTVQNTPGYFDPANIVTRTQTAVAVMMKTSEIAKEWRENRLRQAVQEKVSKANSLAGAAAGVAGYWNPSNKETPEVVKIKTSITI